MSASPISVEAGLDASSTLRMGLTSVTPVRTRETIKRWGVRYSVSRTTYMPPEQTKSIEEYVSFQNEMILSHISLPERFEREKLIALYNEKILTSYYENDELQKRMEDIKSARGSLSALVNFVRYFKRSFKEGLESRLKQNAENYYSSDIPISVYSTFNRGDKLFALHINYVETILNSYNRLMSTSEALANNRVFKRYNRSLRQELDHAFDITEPWFFSEKCLRRILMLWNAPSYDELFELDYAYMKNIPNDEFNQLYDGLKSNIKSARISILVNKRFSLIRDVEKELYQSSFKINNMFNNLFYSNQVEV